MADDRGAWTNMQIIVEYEMNKGRVRITPFNMARLSIDYLPEYAN